MCPVYDERAKQNPYGHCAGLSGGHGESPPVLAFAYIVATPRTACQILASGICGVQLTDTAGPRQASRPGRARCRLARSKAVVVVIARWESQHGLPIVETSPRSLNRDKQELLNGAQRRAAHKRNAFGNLHT